MKTIRTMTVVDAPMDRCFKLALNIDLQRAATGGKPVSGVTSGLIGPGETIAWRGGGVTGGRTYETLIEVWRPYSYFREIMIAGPFEAFEHEHHFAPMNDGTRIRDEVRFTVSSGSVLFRSLTESRMERKITAYLQQCNALLKRVAESGEWHHYLDGQPELDTRIFQAASAIPDKKTLAYAG